MVSHPPLWWTPVSDHSREHEERRGQGHEEGAPRQGRELLQGERAARKTIRPA